MSLRMKVWLSVTAPVWVAATVYFYARACYLLCNVVLGPLFGWGHLDTAAAAIVVSILVLMAALLIGVTFQVLDCFDE